MTESRATATTLHRRLKELRLRGLPGYRSVRQADLSRAFAVAVSSVSSWETNKVPPSERLLAYATFFSSPRSVEATPPRLLRDDELTMDELVERDRLLSELQELRSAAVGGLEPEHTQRGLWHFPDGGAVRIVCGLQDPKDQPRFTGPEQQNYMALSAYADLDALIELFGHVRSENPASNVQFTSVPDLKSDDLQAHVVIVGNVSWKDTPLFQDGLGLPVRQVPDGVIENGEVFEVVTTRDRIGPELRGGRPDGEVIEDVGLFARMINPYNSARTLTVCSGVFTRGTYGAVRCLTDAHLSTSNTDWFRQRFAGSERFGVVMRVRIVDRAIATPDLRHPGNRRYEFSSDD